jgi:acetate kinase
VNVLVLNAGAASLRFQLIRTDQDRIAGDTDERLARGHIERIGGEALASFRVAGQPRRRFTVSLRDQRAAVDAVLQWISDEHSIAGIGGFHDIDAVGHRVAHGGERFTRSVLIDDVVLQQIEENIELAPLHNPHNLKGIRAVRDVLGTALPQAAVFDTAFHQTLSDHAFLYAIPYSLYRRHRVRRYGFHGTSHRYVAYRYRKITGIGRDQTRLITLHLGNGCSACAIINGDSHDTSMGFTPLEGLVMGTRSGDLDPAIIDYIAGKEGLLPRRRDAAQQAVRPPRHQRPHQRYARTHRRGRRARRPPRLPRHRHLLLPRSQVHRRLSRRRRRRRCHYLHRRHR